MRRGNQVIFDVSSPKHGGVKARKLITALGITDVENTFDAVIKVVGEDEWQHCVGELQQLDARKEQHRVAIDTLCGTLSGLAVGVEIIRRVEEST